MRVFERGSGETRSCGTGACAAAIAAAPEGPGRWRVDVPGGTLQVSRDEAGHVYLRDQRSSWPAARPTSEVVGWEA